MFRIWLSLLFLLSNLVQAQDYKYAWISDIHIGYPDADSELDSVVAIINSYDDVKFVIASGDIAEKGTNNELETAKDILDDLTMPYFIIPGNHDTKWSESGCSKFKELWGDDKFYFNENGHVYMGLNSGIPWRGGGGHITPEDLDWLKSKIDRLKNGAELYLVVHHPLDDDIDNSFKALNLLRNANIQAVLCGHGHSNKIMEFGKIPGVMGRSTLSKNEESFGFTLVENTQDSIIFYEVGKERIPDKWGAIVKKTDRKIPPVEKKGNSPDYIDIIWEADLNSTVSAEVLVTRDHIYSAAMNGLVTCFDTSGNVIWEYDTFGGIMSKPAVSDGILAVATVQGDLITLDALTGEQIQTIGFDESITSQLITIEYKGNRQMMIPKQSESNDAVIVGTGSGKLYCLDFETLEEIWSNSYAQGMIQIEPLFIDNKLIYGAWDGHVYCIDAKNGLLIWKWRASNSFYYSPAASKPVTNGTNVFITTPEKKTISIDLLLGKAEWVTDKFKAWESIGISQKGHRIFVKSYEDKFHIASAKTNNWVKELNMKFGLDTMPCEPLEWNDNILFGGKNGIVYHISPDFKWREIYFLGYSRVHSIQRVSDSRFLASNMDGRLIIFKLKD